MDMYGHLKMQLFIFSFFKSCIFRCPQVAFLKSCIFKEMYFHFDICGQEAKTEKKDFYIFKQKQICVDR